MPGPGRATSLGGARSHRYRARCAASAPHRDRRRHPGVASRTGMTAEVIQRLTDYFGTGSSRQAYLARQALGQPLPGDPRLAGRLRQELLAGVRADGTVSGGAVPTIWRVHELLDLGLPGDSSAITRAVAWMLDLQDRPGAFHYGCDRVRHARRLCQHYIAGFFAPAPPVQQIGRASCRERV